LRVATKYKMKFIPFTICEFSAGGLSGRPDYAHENDMYKNIALYYRNQMHKEDFKEYVPYILLKARDLIKRRKIFLALRLALIRLYTKFR
jgi:hypothetical protein